MKAERTPHPSQYCADVPHTNLHFRNNLSQLPPPSNPIQMRCPNTNTQNHRPPTPQRNLLLLRIILQQISRKPLHRIRRPLLHQFAHPIQENRHHRLIEIGPNGKIPARPSRRSGRFRLHLRNGVLPLLLVDVLTLHALLHGLLHHLTCHWGSDAALLHGVLLLGGLLLLLEHAEGGLLLLAVHHLMVVDTMWSEGVYSRGLLHCGFVLWCTEILVSFGLLSLLVGFLALCALFFLPLHLPYEGIST